MPQSVPLASRCAFALCRLLCLQILVSLLPGKGSVLPATGLMLSTLWQSGLGPALALAAAAPFTRCLLWGETCLLALTELPGNLLLVLLLQPLRKRRFPGKFLGLSLALALRQGTQFLGQQCLVSLLPQLELSGAPYWLSVPGAYGTLLWRSRRNRHFAGESPPFLPP